MIMAENPNIKPKEAIMLSRKMMNGKKRKLLMLDLSFFIYQVLDIITLGILGVIAYNPYYTASIVEFYTEAKRDYKENEQEGYELLNDSYLMENPENNDCYPGVKRRYLTTIKSIV